MIIKEDPSILLPVNFILHLHSFVNQNLPMKHQNKFEKWRKNTWDLQHLEKNRCIYLLVTFSACQLGIRTSLFYPIYTNTSHYILCKWGGRKGKRWFTLRIVLEIQRSIHSYNIVHKDNAKHISSWKAMLGSLFWLFFSFYLNHFQFFFLFCD